MLSRRNFNFAATLGLYGLIQTTKGESNESNASFPEGSDHRRVGVRANGAYLKDGIESIDTLSGNLNLTLLLLKAQSRRASIGIALSYNSQLWRKDTAGSWSFGRDTGFGYGWMLQAGSLVPAKSGSNTGYTFVNASGAEYRMVPNGNLWTTRNGVYVTYDPSTNLLWFNDGVSWKMDCAAAASEADAGTLYPTLVQDPNGNQILIRYLPGVGLSTPNTSSRISEIQDARAASVETKRKTYSFLYSADALPHLLSIVSHIGGSDGCQFTYSSPQSIQSPFEDAPSPGLVRVLATCTAGGLGCACSVNGVQARSYEFDYSSNRSAELSAMTLPKGAVVSWDYVTSSFGDGAAVREVAARTLAVAGSPDTHKTFSHPSTDAASAIHTSTQVATQEGSRVLVWSFAANPDSPDYGSLLGYEERSTSQGRTLRSTAYSWQASPDGGCYVGAVVTTLDPDTPYQAQRKTEYVRDIYGNLTEQREYEYGNLSQPARVTANTYVSDPAYISRYLRGLLSSRTAQDQGGTYQLRSVAYDSTPLATCGAVTEHDAACGTSFSLRGNPTEQVIQGNYTSRCYDITGITVSAVDKAGFELTVQPAPGRNNTVPGACVLNGDAAMIYTFDFDSALRPVKQTRPNGDVTTITYDGAGRVLTKVTADGKVTTHSYADDGLSSTVSTNGKWLRKSVDGLGRVILEERGAGDATASVREQVYDLVHPLKVTQASNWHAPGDSPVWRSWKYDELGRVTSRILAGGSGVIQLSYAGTTLTKVDPAGRVKTMTYNAGGALTQVAVKDAATGRTLTTQYSYTLKRLTKVAMPHSQGTQVRLFTYDSFGRLVKRQHPESGVGRITYNLDNTTNMTVDAKNQAKVYAYDAFKRVTSVSQYLAPGQLDPSQGVTYYYDSNPIAPGFSQCAAGRRTAAQWGSVQSASGQFTEMYSYSPGGKLVAKRLTLARGGASASLDLTFAYDNDGNLTTIAYPGNLGSYRYSYDSLGRLASMTADGEALPIVKNAQYSPSGRITSIQKLIPGTTQYYLESRQYNSRNQLTRLTAGPETPGANDLPRVDLTYVYDPTRNDGRIQSIVDSVANETLLYSYDSAGRLHSVETADNRLAQSFEYDDLGNLHPPDPTAAKAPYTALGVHTATNRIVGSGTQYDANGNLTAIGGMQLQYDAGNRLTQIDTLFVGSEQHAYSPGNLRVWTKFPDGHEEITLNGPGGRRLATFVVSCDSGRLTLTPKAAYIYFGKQLIHSGGSLVILDRTNSVRLRTANGPDSNAASFAYFPFGQSRDSAGSLALANAATGEEQFGGYPRSGKSPLDYAKQRYYFPSLGRFLTPDPTGRNVDFSDPQTWNRYAFVNNDPVNLVDPSGLETDSGYSGDGGGGGYGGGGGNSGNGGGSGGTCPPFTPSPGYNCTINGNTCAVTCTPIGGTSGGGTGGKNPNSGGGSGGKNPNSGGGSGGKNPNSGGGSGGGGEISNHILGGLVTEIIIVGIEEPEFVAFVL
jgi:RHS repeat-associated protein